MRSLFNNHNLPNWIIKSAITFSIVPAIYIVPVVVFQIPLESFYDYFLEVTRLYCVLLLSSMIGKLINSKMIKLGLYLAIANGVYDTITEIILIEQLISHRFPFADALLDEGLLIASYGCIINGLFQHFNRINALTLTDNLTQCYNLSTVPLIPFGAYQVFYFNLDNFKRINQTQGHDVGNKVLVNFAAQLMHSTSNNGYVFRVEGDKFITVIDVNCAQHFIDSFNQSYQQEHIAFSYGTAACFDNKLKQAIDEARDNLNEIKSDKEAMCIDRTT
ncbi:GGDEF domain-containing protein [Vibrio renipiscarius]|uniref:GGDEF domain-containing protein n=1 Tax=Vibrio renipiscarius TaxID=1461322 RepID=UPI00354D39EB